MPPIRTEIRAHYAFQLNRVEIALIEQHEFGRFIARPVQMVELNEHAIIEPTMQLTRDEAAMLMDELWQCGIRPSERLSGVGDLGTLSATKAHLTDMQTIALALLRDKGVQL